MELWKKKIKQLYQLQNDYNLDDHSELLLYELLKKYSYNLLKEFMPISNCFVTLDEINEVKKDLERVYLKTISKRQDLNLKELFPNIEYLFSFETILNRICSLGWIDLYEDTEDNKIILIKGFYYDQLPQFLKDYFISDC